MNEELQKLIREVTTDINNFSADDTSKLEESIENAMKIAYNYGKADGLTRGLEIVRGK